MTTKTNENKSETETNENKPKRATNGKRVELFIPRGAANDEEILLISVNGENYLLPRGKASLVPEHIANEYNRAQKAQARLYEKAYAMQQAAK